MTAPPNTSLKKQIPSSSSQSYFYLMKYYNYLVGILFFTISPLKAEVESWTRMADNVTISAELMSFDSSTNKVKLKLKNGKQAEIDASILIEPHRDRLAKRAEETAAKKLAAAKSRLESFVPENGGGHKIHVYKPAGYMEKDSSSLTRPIAFLYSAGGNSMSLVKRLKPVADELGWVLVGVDAYRNTKSLEDRYKERMKDTQIAFEWVKKNLYFDAKKIVFGGMSGGGWWSYQSASDLTREAAGILSFGGWMGNMHDKKYSKKMAVAMINGDKDKNANSCIEKDEAFLKRKASAKIKVYHFPGGHVLAPSDVALEAARWIHETKGFGVVSE